MNVQKTYINHYNASESSDFMALYKLILHSHLSCYSEHCTAVQSRFKPEYSSYLLHIIEKAIEDGKTFLYFCFRQLCSLVRRFRSSNSLSSSNNLNIRTLVTLRHGLKMTLRIRPVSFDSRAPSLDGSCQPHREVEVYSSSSITYR